MWLRNQRFCVEPKLTEISMPLTRTNVEGKGARAGFLSAGRNSSFGCEVPTCLSDCGCVANFSDIRGNIILCNFKNDRSP